MKAYITKIEYYLPEKVEENELGRLRKKTGIERRHICGDDETAADLAYKAAEKLFADGVDKSSIEYVILCTQSPDYYLPTTACILQDRLGLNISCGAIDYNLGCSGYIYGLGLAKGLIESGQVKNVLLLTAETYSKYIHPNDGTVRPLFGDAATATLITAVDTELDGIKGLTYGTDGSGAGKLIVPVGGMRQRHENTDVKEITDQYGNFRTNINLYMDGAGIMDFALEHVPDLVDEVLAKTKLTKSDVDYYVFHQANKFMLKYLREKCGLGDYPYWNDVTNYGNTVSNSIPIALKDMLEVRLSNNMKNIMIAGFGVGLSYGGAIIDLSIASMVETRFTVISQQKS